LVDATDGIAIGVLHGCIGKCCTEKYPSVFVNLADEAIWNFVYKNAGLPCDGLKDKRGIHSTIHTHIIKMIFLKLIFEQHISHIEM
jgi:hypothetical protein